MSHFKKYPRMSTIAILILLSALGYYRKSITENARVRTLVESAMKADKDIQSLVFAYQIRSGTVRSLVQYAVKRNIDVPTDVRSALNEAIDGPDVKNVASLRTYLVDQIKLTTAAKELITSMDAELPPTDHEFGKLFKEFQAEEASLARIRESYDEQTQRVRQLARKGDRVPERL